MKTKNQSFAMMQKAVGFHQKGQIPEAERSYQDVLALDPRHADALRLLGSLYFQWNKVGDAIGCFEKALKIQPHHPELLNNLGVALSSQGKIAEAITLYLEAVKISPNYLDAINNLANATFASEKKDGALIWLRRSVALKPDAIEMLTKLGNLLREAGQSEEACKHYQRLAELQPDDSNIHLNLGTLFHDMGKLPEALQHYEKALKLEPGSRDAMMNRAGLLIELNRPEEAWASYGRILSSDPHLSTAKWGKSMAMLMLGKYPDGWALYESRFDCKPMCDAVLFRASRWDGSTLEGKRLLIWGEQGLGDVLQFIRYAALCKTKGGTIIVQCREPLVRLLKNCPFIDEVVTTATKSDFDYQIPIMSLPHVFGTTLDTIPNTTPYVFVDEETRNKWAPHFVGAKDFKVGLVWAGNPRKNQLDAHVIDRQRSMELALLKPLFDIKNCQFYNLQKEDVSAEIKANGLEEKLINLMPAVADFMDTAAIIENLDLVISVDTSVVHLAGALGKPVWILSRFGGCWRWLGNQKLNPWYPTAQIFGQPAPGDWKGSVNKVVSALQEKLMKHGH